MSVAMQTRAEMRPVAPDRSLQQRRDALAVANEIRTQRKHLKRDLKAGRRTVVNVLLEVPVWAESMKVLDLLLATPKVGRVKANKALAQTRMSPSKTLGGMTMRQRTELVAWLRR